MAYSFLASDDAAIIPGGAISASTSARPSNKNSSNIQKALHDHVFCWGLNDKEQLGSPKGSKVKLPVLNETLVSRARRLREAPKASTVSLRIVRCLRAVRQPMDD